MIIAGVTCVLHHHRPSGDAITAIQDHHHLSAGGDQHEIVLLISVGCSWS
jgi:hypothetical protein